MTALRAVLALALVLGAAAAASAHPLAPALLELREQADGRVALTWRRPPRTLPGVTRQPVLPAACTQLETGPPTVTPLSLTEHGILDCGGSLVGQRFGVSGLAESGTDALLRVELADGRSFQRVLRGAAPEALIPPAPSPLALVRDYLRLGAEHILSGPDHLLFVLGLILLVSGFGMLVRTITAFTLGHSLTLSLAMLGFVRFPVAPLELLIAASVFWLAVELARGAPLGRASWTRRFPWLMAGGFGLLHGLGFAGALAATGLPAGEIPLALLSFNLGIELGQLVFVAAVLALGVALAAARRRVGPLPAWTTQVPAYAMGSLAALWCLDRALVAFS